MTNKDKRLKRVKRLQIAPVMKYFILTRVLESIKTSTTTSIEIQDFEAQIKDDISKERLFMCNRPVNIFVNDVKFEKGKKYTFIPDIEGSYNYLSSKSKLKYSLDESKCEGVIGKPDTKYKLYPYMCRECVSNIIDYITDYVLKHNLNKIYLKYNNTQFVIFVDIEHTQCTVLKNLKTDKVLKRFILSDLVVLKSTQKSEIDKRKQFIEDVYTGEISIYDAVFDGLTYCWDDLISGTDEFVSREVLLRRVSLTCISYYGTTPNITVLSKVVDKVLVTQFPYIKPFTSNSKPQYGLLYKLDI